MMLKTNLLEQQRLSLHAHSLCWKAWKSLVIQLPSTSEQAYASQALAICSGDAQVCLVFYVKLSVSLLRAKIVYVCSKQFVRMR